MKLILIYTFLVGFLLNCLPSKEFTNNYANNMGKKKNIYFSEEEVDYSSQAISYSYLTKDKNIVDVKNKLSIGALEKIKNLEIYPSNTMNFINSYNDTINVVFSFPKRECLADEISSYLWNFSTSMQYVIIETEGTSKVDSLQISHETRIVPPIDCAENNNLPNHELIHSGKLK